MLSYLPTIRGCPGLSFRVQGVDTLVQGFITDDQCLIHAAKITLQSKKLHALIKCYAHCNICAADLSVGGGELCDVKWHIHHRDETKTFTNLMRGRSASPNDLLPTRKICKVDTSTYCISSLIWWVYNSPQLVGPYHWSIHHTNTKLRTIWRGPRVSRCIFQEKNIEQNLILQDKFGYRATRNLG